MLLPVAAFNVLRNPPTMFSAARLQFRFLPTAREGSPSPTAFTVGQLSSNGPALTGVS